MVFNYKRQKKKRSKKLTKEELEKQKIILEILKLLITTYLDIFK